MSAHRKILAALALGTASLVAPLRAQIALPPVVEKTARNWSPRQSPVVDVVRRVKDCVVNIHSERTVKAAAADELSPVTPSQNRVNGMGTGIIIDPRGYIITNQHVVDDVSSLRVRLSDGTTVTARVVSRDLESDLALLKINPPKPLPVMPLGTARDVRVGESTIAIGNAYGYDHTVTTGIVSAIGRDVTLNREVKYKALIQTDAAINPGNSGGPLINLDGELIGVNVAIRAGAQGIGFAIPVDSMIRVASSMLAHARGGVTSGMTVHDDVPGTVSTRRVVLDQADGAAAKAGLQRGDVIVRVGDQQVKSALDIERALIEREPGQKLAVVVSRAGVEKRHEMALDAAPRKAARPLIVTGVAATVWRSLGVRLTAMPRTGEVSRTHPRLNGGMLINDVRPDSPAAKAGLRIGDILVGLHQWEMLTLDNVNYVLTHPERGTFSPVQFYILRSGHVHRGALAISE